MHTLTFEFETEEHMKEFIGWFLDGGGEDEFYMSVEAHLGKPFVTEWNHPITVIKVKEAPAEE